MIHVVYKVNEVDCQSCLNFLLNKLKKYQIDVEIFCGQCNTLTVKLEDESEIETVSKIISEAGYDNQFVYVGTTKHTHIEE